MTDAATDNKWHLDKKVPLALMFMIGAQTVAAIWWAASVSQRVDALERNALAAAPRLESVIRLETKVDFISSTLQELKALAFLKKK